MSEYNKEVIANLAGYYAYNKLNFYSKREMEIFHSKMKYIGYKKCAMYDKNSMDYLNSLTEDVSWICTCPDIEKLEYINGYLSAVYPKDLEELKDSDFIIIDEIVYDIMSEFAVDHYWYTNYDDMMHFFKTITLTYNSFLMKDIAVALSSRPGYG